MLGTYYVDGKEKLVVACVDFCEPGEEVVSFARVKNTYVDSESGGYDTELNPILDAIERQQVYDSFEVLNRFWDMFVADALLGNFDWHNGNWGFLINQEKQTVRLAPVYDNGSL